MIIRPKNNFSIIQGPGSKNWEASNPSHTIHNLILWYFQLHQVHSWSRRINVENVITIEVYGPLLTLSCEDLEFTLGCHDLAKQLSHYLYFFYFLLFYFLLPWTYYTGRSAGKCHGRMTGSHSITSHDGSHDKCGKVVHRPCSSCISSVENPMGTPLSSPCQLRLGGWLSHLG